MTTYIGIDPATACGWAVLAADGSRLASGVWNLKVRRGEGCGMRYVRARSYLLALIDAYPGSLLGYEEVARHKGPHAAHVYGGLAAVITSVCEERGVPYSGQPVGSVKRQATGKGTASKDAMIGAALARWGAVEDDNEADALWVADLLRAGLA